MIREAYEGAAMYLAKPAAQREVMRPVDCFLRAQAGLADPEPEKAAALLLAATGRRSLPAGCSAL